MQPAEHRRAYVVACCGVYFKRAARTLACGICVCCNWTYKDNKFPASAQSIGAWGGRSPAQIDEQVDWWVMPRVGMYWNGCYYQ